MRTHGAITTRNLAATLVAVAVFSAGAGPASAVTGGFGIARALHGTPIAITAQQVVAKDKRDSCEASGVQVPGSSKSSGPLKNFDRKFAPVACEQPPRSQFTSDSLNKAAQAALALIGRNPVGRNPVGASSWRCRVGLACVAGTT